VRVILQTERLTLRQFTEDDTANLYELNSDPEVMRYLTGGRPTPREVLRDEVKPFHLAVYERRRHRRLRARRGRVRAH
jgi:RimJ/RimL family protein N-acetyltransferase